VESIDAPSGDLVGPALVAARGALAALARLDLDALPSDELTKVVLESQRLRAQLDAVEARVLVRWEADGAWRVDGARSAAAWLAWRQRLPLPETRRRLRHARAALALPAVASAWADGEIDRAHVATLLSVRTPRTERAFACGHEALLDLARRSRFCDFQRRCRRWELMADPDGAEQDAEAARAGRSLHLSESFGGMWFGRMTLDPVAGAAVHEVLAGIEQELFEAEWTAGRDRLGRDPFVTELERAPAQRRADAFLEMAIRARTAPADGRRPAPLFTVVVGYETFAGPVLELFNRTVLTPGAAARWLTEAEVERVVFESPSRVIDVGARRRFFRGALRRAIEVRDRECFHPTCEDLPRFPEVDHIQPASRGGPTTLANGRLACGFHNRQRRSAEVDDRGGRPGEGEAGPDPPDG